MEHIRGTLNVLDLFSGAGGMALGFQAAGCRCIGAVEKDTQAAQTFQTMFAPDQPRVFGGPEDGDIASLSPEQLLSQLPVRPDIIVGGPPCQGFSRVGRAKQRSLLDREEHRQAQEYRPERNELYRHFLAVVRHARPVAFVIENVPGIRDAHQSDIAHRLAREGAALGYNLRYFLLNAAWYGVPQRRWRLFFLGLRCDLGPTAIPRPPIRRFLCADNQQDFLAYPEDPWMLGITEIPEVDCPEPEVDVFDALGDLPRLKGHLRSEQTIPDVDTILPLRRSPSAYVRRLRTWPHHPAMAGVTDNWYRWTPRDFGTFAEMAHGDTYPAALEIARRRFHRHLRSLPSPPVAGSDAFDALRRQFIPPYPDNKFRDKWRKLYTDRASWTVTAHLSRDGYSHIHYDSRQARTITIREAARLQSFPDGFRFSGNHGDRFRQIGNAVPPLMARALAESLIQQLERLGVMKQTRSPSAHYALPPQPVPESVFSLECSIST